MGISVDQVVDVCFNQSSFWVVTTVMGSLTATISTLFGLLMLSYRGRIQSAEHREQDAYHDRDEALYRLRETRHRYRTFVEEETEQRQRQQQPRSSRFRLSAGEEDRG